MTEDRAQLARHQADVAAPARYLYGLVADALAAPLVFPGTVHVQYLDRTASQERLRIWAVNGEEPRTWVSHRRLDPEALCVTFQQEAPAPPIAFMRGEWRMTALDSDRTRVTLSHAYRAVDDDAAALAWIEQMVDRVSGGQLAALGAYAALGGPVAGPVLSIQDSVELDCPVEAAYAAAHDPASWSDLPPIAVQQGESAAAPDMQLLQLAAPDAGGGSRASHSARVCFADSHIAFKELLCPPLVAAHTGCWQFEPAAGGSRVSARHRVAVHYGAARDVLGAGATDVDARTYARQAVGAASLAALEQMVSLTRGHRAGSMKS
jgi:ribosome-associated toxin RatA of RatAB toxin-antitoxin module